MIKGGESIDYVVVGGLCVDNIINDEGTERLFQFGGNAAYGSAGVRIWAQGGIGMVARAGIDYPEEWLGKMAKAGIDTRGVRRLPKPHMLGGGMIYDGNGNRRGNVSIKDFKIATDDMPELPGYSRALWHQAQLDFGGRAEDIPDAYASARGVLLAPRYYDNQYGCIEFFRKRAPGAKIILDPGEWYLDPDEEAKLSALFSGADVVLPSEAEARVLFGDTPLDEAAKRLSRMGPAVVVVKVGRDGCIVYERERDCLTAIPVVKVNAQDATGAGDSFCGGFLVGLLEHDDPIIAAMYGTVSSSFIIEGFGADYSLGVKREDAELRLAELKRAVLNARPQLASRLSAIGGGRV